MVDILLLIAIAFLAYTDWRTRRIPNIVTFPLMLIGILWGVYSGAWRESLLGLLGTFVVLLPLGAINGLGFGDVKLLMAIGAFKGPLFVLDVFVFALIVNLILGLVLAPKRFLEGLRTFFHMLLGLFVLKITHRIEESALKIPFAVCVLLGTLITYYLGGEGCVWRLLV